MEFLGDFFPVFGLILKQEFYVAYHSFMNGSKSPEISRHSVFRKMHILFLRDWSEST